MKTRTIEFCSHLEAIVDQRLFRRMPDEDEMDGSIPAAIAGAGAVGGGVIGHKAIMKKYGARQLLGPGEILAGSPRSVLSRQAMSGATNTGTATVGGGAAYRAAAADATGRTVGAGNAARIAGKQAYQVTRSNGEGLLKSSLAGLRKALKVGGRKLVRG